MSSTKYNDYGSPIKFPADKEQVLKQDHIGTHGEDVSIELQNSPELKLANKNKRINDQNEMFPELLSFDKKAVNKIKAMEPNWKYYMG